MTGKRGNTYIAIRQLMYTISLSSSYFGRTLSRQFEFI
jgi:predicted heme/steroid binding protein